MLCRTDYPRTVSIALAVVEAKEVFAVQDDVTQEIVSALVSKMRRAETARAKRKREAKSGQHVDVCRALRCGGCLRTQCHAPVSFAPG